MRTSFKKTATRLLGSGLTALWLGGAVTSTASAATEIQFWHAFTGRLEELLNKQVNDFNASQGDYKVVAVPKGNYSEALNAGIAAFRAGQQPHILQVFEVGTATMMAAKGAVKPVYELMAEAKEPFNPADYIGPVAGYYTTADGKMLSLPYNSSTQVLYYNKAAFEKAGIDPNSPPKTWPEMDEALKKLKAAGIDCPYTTSWQSWVHLESFSAYHNVLFSTKANGFEGLDTELAFNTPLHVKHIEMLGRWAKDGLFHYGGRRNEAAAKFRAGECATLTESSAGYAGVKKEAQFPFGIANLPYWPDVEGAPQNTIIGGASLWVMNGKSAEEYKGVAKFLTYLSSPAVQAQWHQDTGYLPITHAAAKLTEEQGFYKNEPGTDTAIKQLTAKAPTANSKGVRIGNFDQVRTVIDEELEAVWSGQKSAKDALDAAIQRGNELLRRFEEANRG